MLSCLAFASNVSFDDNPRHTVGESKLNAANHPAPPIRSEAGTFRRVEAVKPDD